MMIAEKLLACATPAPLDPRNTLFLSNWASTGAPAAQIGTIVTSPVVTSPWTVAMTSDVSGTFDAPVGSLDSWVVDMFIAGTVLPSLSMSASMGVAYNMAVTSGNDILLSGEIGWIYGVVPPRLPGLNHLAFGRQGGKMQAWLNGARFFDDTSTTILPPGGGVGGIYIYAAAWVEIGPVRLVGADVYGDSATITVPAIPLGII